MYEIILSVLEDLCNSFESLMKHVLYLNGDILHFTAGSARDFRHYLSKGGGKRNLRLNQQVVLRFFLLLFFFLWQNSEAVIRDLEEKVGHEPQCKDPLDNLVIPLFRENRAWLKSRA